MQPLRDAGRAPPASVVFPDDGPPPDELRTFRTDEATHLDLVADHPVDLVLVSSPLSMFAPMRALLRAEIRRFYRAAPMIAFEPRGAALEAMGRNPMAIERSADVARAAYETTSREIEGPLKGALRALEV